MPSELSADQISKSISKPVGKARDNHQRSQRSNLKLHCTAAANALRLILDQLNGAPSQPNYRHTIGVQRQISRGG